MLVEVPVLYTPQNKLRVMLHSKFLANSIGLSRYHNIREIQLMIPYDKMNNSRENIFFLKCNFWDLKNPHFLLKIIKLFFLIW